MRSQLAFVGIPAKKTIADAVRRQLWWLAGRRCAFPDCQQRLFEAGAADDSVYVGHECHIVAQKDDRRVARAPSSLTAEEKVRWRHLIDDRHGVANLVLMCQTHSKLIDTVTAGCSVEDVVDMKAAQEKAAAVNDARARSERFAEAPSAIPPVLLLDDVNEWERTSLRALAQEDPVGLAWLTAAVGSPSEAARVKAVIASDPPEARDGSVALRVAIARAAESHGLWAEAASVWERLAEEVGWTAADFLARAAAAADATPDEDEHTRGCWPPRK